MRGVEIVYLDDNYRYGGGYEVFFMNEKGVRLLAKCSEKPIQEKFIWSLKKSKRATLLGYTS